MFAGVCVSSCENGPKLRRNNWIGRAHDQIEQIKYCTYHLGEEPIFYIFYKILVRFLLLFGIKISNMYLVDIFNEVKL